MKALWTRVAERAAKVRDIKHGSSSVDSTAFERALIFEALLDINARLNNLFEDNVIWRAR